MTLPTSFGANKTSSRPAKDEDVFQRFIIRNDSINGSGRSLSDTESESEADTDTDTEALEVPLTHRIKVPGGDLCVSATKFSSKGDKLFSSRGTMLSQYIFSQETLLSDSSTHSLKFDRPIERLLLNPQTDSLLLLFQDYPRFQILSSGELTSADSGFLSPQGDILMHDVNQTRGHVGAVTGASFTTTNQLWTCSKDSTVRAWDLERQKQTNVFAVKKNGIKQPLVGVENVCGNIALNQQNRLSIWDPKEGFVRPINEIEIDGSDLLNFTKSNKNDNQLLLKTRSRLQIYDIRNANTPLLEKRDIHSTSKNLLWADNNFILTNFEKSKLEVIDPSDLFTVKSLDFDNEVECFDWNVEINQLSIGLQSGTNYINFDPKISNNGIINTILNKPKKRKIFDEVEDFGTVKTDQVGFNMYELQEMRKQKKSK